MGYDYACGGIAWPHECYTWESTLATKTDNVTMTCASDPDTHIGSGNISGILAYIQAVTACYILCFSDACCSI